MDMGGRYCAINSSRGSRGGGGGGGNPEAGGQGIFASTATESTAIRVVVLVL